MVRVVRRGQPDMGWRSWFRQGTKNSGRIAGDRETLRGK